MASHASNQRQERSATWPPATGKLPEQTITCTSTASEDQAQAFRDDLEQHPERHFLSPITADEYYGWDSDDSDLDSDDGGEWNAGITDFSLFTADRKRAIETGEPLPDKWNFFVESQGELYKKSLKTIAEEEDEGVPGLTPDASPNLRDDVEDDDGQFQQNDRPIMPQIQITPPDYLTMEVKPSTRSVAFGPDDELPLTFSFPRKEPRSKATATRVQRPGLRHARTLSGKKHVWRRPGWDMFTVGEDVIGETEAELEDIQDLRVVRSTGALELASRD